MKKILFLVAILTYSQGFGQILKKQPKQNLVIINTRFGTIYCKLYDQTPLHRDNFLKLVKEKFYDSTTFHRIIKGFMIQGGDPNSKDNIKENDGQGGNGYTIPAEFVPELTHVQGALAAARMGDQVNPKKESSGCQFYIVENKTGAHFLDNNYTVFGQVLHGIEVVEKIAEQPKDYRDRPLEDIKMTIRVERLKPKKMLKKYQVKWN